MLEIQLHGGKHVFWKEKIQEKEAEAEVGWGRLAGLEDVNRIYCLCHQTCNISEEKALPLESGFRRAVRWKINPNPARPSPLEVI